MSRVIDELNFQGPRSRPPKCSHGFVGGEMYGCHECRDEAVVFENGKYWLNRPGDLFDGVRLTDCCQAMDKGTELGIVCRKCWRVIEGTGECYEYRTPEQDARHRKATDKFWDELVS